MCPAEPEDPGMGYDTGGRKKKKEKDRKCKEGGWYVPGEP